MRKKKAPKRYVQPDPKFGDVMVTQFVNRLMYEGKKSIEQVKKIYEALYEKGAKGGTVYVDGCRDFQVLSLEKNNNQYKNNLQPLSAKYSSNSSPWLFFCFFLPSKVS